MSKFDEKLKIYLNEFQKLKVSVDKDLLTKVTRSLGPSIYNNDAAKVAGSDPEELKRIKTNFLIQKLGMKDSSTLDAAIESVMETMGRSNRNKYRAMVYYLLVVKLGKQMHY
jgi:hypothetical protein